MKLNVKRTMLAGLAFMAISGFWAMYNAVTPLILEKTFSLNATFNGVVMAMDNILAVFLLPIFGVWSDKTNTRIGKRMPFIIIGTIFSILAMIFMPIADNDRNFVLFLVATGAVLLFMSFYRSPAVALMPDITPRQLRSKGNAVIMLMGTVGVIYTMIVTKILVPDVEKPDYIPLFIAMIVLMGITLIVMEIFVDENKWKKEARKNDVGNEEENKNAGKKISRPRLISLIFLLLSVAFWYMAYNGVETALSRYTVAEWNMGPTGYTTYMLIATVTAVVCYIPIGIVSGILGRKKVICAGVIGLALAFFLCIFFKGGGVLLMMVFGLLGISWGAINVNSFPMVVEIASDGDEGKYTGFYYMFSMVAQILTPILSGFLIDKTGSYKVLFPYATVFAVLAFITMMMVRHGDTVSNKKKSLLEHLDVDA